MTNDPSKTGAPGWERIMVLIGEVKSCRERFEATIDEAKSLDKTKVTRGQLDLILIERTSAANALIKKQHELINALLQREGQRIQLL